MCFENVVQHLLCHGAQFRVAQVAVMTVNYKGHSLRRFFVVLIDLRNTVMHTLACRPSVYARIDGKQTSMLFCLLQQSPCCVRIGKCADVVFARCMRFDAICKRL